MTPQQRLARMRATFEKSRAILVEDYEHFATPRESSPPSTVARKSAGQSSRPAPKQSGKRSSGKSDD